VNARSVTRRATLKDIAASVGLSVNTVSRALAGKDAVNEHTRALIQAEADRLAYVPNAMARSLVVGSAMAFGLVITNPSNPFYATLISAIEQRARVHGYSLVLMVSEENLDNELRAAKALQRWGVDGAIVVPVQQGAEHWRRLQSAGIPLVLVNRDLPELECDFVGIDFADGAYRATCHLLDHRISQVLLLEEDLSVSSVQERIDGFRRALGERSAADRDIIRVPTRRLHSSALPWDPADAYHVAERLIGDLAAGASILVGSDYFALGAYRAIREARRTIPTDVAVMGYGDHPFAAFLDPPLSSVQLPAADVGMTAVNLLVRRLNAKRRSVRTKKVRLAPGLVLRASTAADEARSVHVSGRQQPAPW
jgi:LacI family transcriptional regulator